jgi:hypothetical protein
MEQKFVVDIALSLTIDELFNLRKVADKMQVPVSEAVRYCMNKKCQELLNDLSVVDTGTQDEDVSESSHQDGTIPETTI